MKITPIHMLHIGGYFDPDVNTYCRLGDGFDRGFNRGTQDWNKVTCKNCLKQKPMKTENICPCCDTKMKLTDREFDRPGVVFTEYTCPKCGHVESDFPEASHSGLKLDNVK